MRILILIFAAAISLHATSKELCTVVMDPATKAVRYWNGSCSMRFSPASTFKIPLAVIGYDAGFLTSASEPLMEYREGDVDWGGEAWKIATDPSRWMRYSVVWYSQRVATAVGPERLETYARRFGLGNADFSRDPQLGSTPAWVGSTLMISPVEQVQFISRLVTRELPVSPLAMEQATALLETRSSGGWTIRAKTGSTGPIQDGSPQDNRQKGLGWYVGWAEKDGRTLAFAYLSQDDRREGSPAGLRARNHLLENWPRVVEAIGP